MSAPAAIRTARRLGLALAVAVCLLCTAAAWAKPAGGNRTPGTATTPVSAMVVLDVKAIVNVVPGTGAALHYRGTFTGQPFGHGTVTVTVKLVGGNAVVDFVLKGARGTLGGTGTAIITYKGGKVTYQGSATVTHGTGAYRTFRSDSLTVVGASGVNPQVSTIRLAGPMTTS